MGTVLSAFYRLVRYHLGTAAFGSFIIALIQLIRLILKYLESKVEDWEVFFIVFINNVICGVSEKRLLWSTGDCVERTVEMCSVLSLVF